MRVCLICEGSYPYVAGGVASWVQMVCDHFKEIEFVIWSIATTKEEMSEYKYNLPENVVGVETIYLGEKTFGNKYKKIKLSQSEEKVLKSLIIGSPENINWKDILEFIKKYRTRLVDVLMGEAFYNICLEEYIRTKSSTIFKDYLWSMRSMYFPFVDVLAADVVKADIYHSLSTGYAGILASAASFIEEKPLLLSEHGIYTREREEDIIRAEWVDGQFKENWINFYKKISTVAYEQAQVVTSLFEVNKTLQIELGCPKEKIRIIPNGVDVESFDNLVSAKKLPGGSFNIGTILRVVPIKDVKTMLLAFEIVSAKIPEAHLAILGAYEENPEYYEECLELVESLNIMNVKFFGRVNIKEYMPDIDLLLLSSISEGQPLAILEGLAAGIPFVSTNVGDCKGLLEGNEGDDLGRAGLIVPVMDSKEMAKAIIYCADNREQLKEMGRVGRKRVEKYYKKIDFMEKYRELYEELGGKADGRNRI